MKKVYHRTLAIFNQIKSKIVFYPTVFALAGILAALFIMYLEERGISKYLLDVVPFLIVNNGDTALTLLSALITGLISMMVFSFSMVMLLLSQASNNYSPRLLPGLISNKTHQVILGIYLGTILFNIFILFSIQPTGDKYQLPGFSVLMGIIFTVLCIYAFIYFIHNISESIQISKILDEIYIKAKKRLMQEIEEDKEADYFFPSSETWAEYYSPNSGYLQSVTFINLLEICKKENLKIHILPVLGIFVLKGIPLFKVNKTLSEDTIKRILSNFNFSKAELVEENPILAFKQICEVVVKAMSPGINDPGTALNGIDYLSELFFLRLRQEDEEIFSKDKKALVKINSVSFQDLLYNVMASIRTYCKHDVILLQKLMVMFKYLKIQSAELNRQQDCINLEIQTLLKDAKETITNERDFRKVSSLALEMGIKPEDQKITGPKE